MGMLAGRYQKAGQYPKGSRGAGGHWFYTERITQPAIEAASEIIGIANQHGCDAAQLALTWVKDQSGITSTLIGPRTQKHLDSALEVLEMSLDQSISQELDAVVPPGSAVSNFFNNSGWMKS
jgi:aryl-alcohol dehydrogenase-like predicted oxidoreductase